MKRYTLYDGEEMDLIIKEVYSLLNFCDLYAIWNKGHYVAWDKKDMEKEFKLMQKVAASPQDFKLS